MRRTDNSFFWEWRALQRATGCIAVHRLCQGSIGSNVVASRLHLSDWNDLVKVGASLTLVPGSACVAFGRAVCLARSWFLRMVMHGRVKGSARDPLQGE